MSEFSVVASPVFKLSVQRLKGFLSYHYSTELADKTLHEVQHKIAQVLPKHPQVAPISERLLELGVQHYRQWHVDQHNIVFYRINEAKAVVELLLLIDARQSLRKLLFEVNLLS
ncbi:type II toxin-antitoxin system RelE/ParE family toxin [Pseudidiomarina sp.]|uniref:type II toxin-antitoxin system RelE/ParE family toxin n=1 Tax=Pseudidiomarina sp. TaxID=2081707 RepID=UPI003A9702F0